MQRTNRERLSAERQKRLEALDGWVWDAFEALWKSVSRSSSSMWRKMAMHATEPARATTWEVTTQRATKKMLSPRRRARLEALNGWVWNRFEADWEEGVMRLQQFVDAEGHARVPSSYRTSEGYWA